jgi:hypothetical protein
MTEKEREEFILTTGEMRELFSPSFGISSQTALEQALLAINARLERMELAKGFASGPPRMESPVPRPLMKNC